MSLLRLLFGLLVAATFLVTVGALLIGRWMLLERDDITAWQVYGTPAVMLALCLLSFGWLRRRES